MLLAGPWAAAQVQRGWPQVDLSLAEVTHDAFAGLEVGNRTPGASAIGRIGCHRGSLAPRAMPARGAARHARAGHARALGLTGSVVRGAARRRSRKDALPDRDSIHRRSLPGHRGTGQTPTSRYSSSETGACRKGRHMSVTSWVGSVWSLRGVEGPVIGQVRAVDGEFLTMAVVGIGGEAPDGLENPPVRGGERPVRSRIFGIAARELEAHGRKPCLIPGGAHTGTAGSATPGNAPGRRCDLRDTRHPRRRSRTRAAPPSTVDSPRSSHTRAPPRRRAARRPRGSAAPVAWRPRATNSRWQSGHPNLASPRARERFYT